jgi:hypothetical protein
MMERAAGGSVHHRLHPGWEERWLAGREQFFELWTDGEESGGGGSADGHCARLSAR